MHSLHPPSPASPSFLRLPSLLPSDRCLSPNSQDSPVLTPRHVKSSCMDRPNSSADLRYNTASRRLQPHKARAAHSPRCRAQFGIPSPFWNRLYHIQDCFFVCFLRSFCLSLATLLVVPPPIDFRHYYRALQHHPSPLCPCAQRRTCRNHSVYLVDIAIHHIRRRAACCWQHRLELVLSCSPLLTACRVHVYKSLSWPQPGGCQ